MSRVVVIGGGPGGSTAATLLGRQGHAVVLFEREHFPRDAHRRVAAARQPSGPRGARRATGDGRRRLPQEMGRDHGLGRRPRAVELVLPGNEPALSAHVTRCGGPASTRSCSTTAGTNGVDVREGHRVVEVLFDATAGRRAVRYEATTARGRRGWRLRRRRQWAGGHHRASPRLRRWDPFFRNMAVYGYFAGAGRLPDPDGTNILVEAYPHGWCWDERR